MQCYDLYIVIVIAKEELNSGFNKIAIHSVRFCTSATKKYS